MPDRSKKRKSQPQAKPPEQAESFDFGALAEDQGSYSSLARKKRARKSPVLIGVILAGIGLLGCLAAGLLLSGGSSATIPEVGDQDVEELANFELSLAIEASRRLGSKPTPVYSLAKAPEGAEIDAKTGRFSFRPTEQQGPGLYDVVVQVRDEKSEKPLARRAFRIFVTEKNQPPVLQAIERQEVAADGLLELTVEAEDPDDPPRRLGYRLSADCPKGAKIDSRRGTIRWNPGQAGPGTYRFTVQVVETVSGGASAEQSFEVHVTEPENPPPVAEIVAAPADDGEQSDAELFEGIKSREPVEPSGPSDFEGAFDRSALEDDSQEILLDLFKKKKLFTRTAYATLRKVFADRYQKWHRNDIKDALGEDLDAMTRWWDAHPEIKEELFIAIIEEKDDHGGVATLFNELRKQYSQELESCPELAIATAVTWEKQQGIYDYIGHQRRTKSKLPDGRIGALENFAYLAGGESYLKNLAQCLPWEFLVHVVNHRTPRDERDWARSNYFSKIRQIGKCYKDVPYDGEMLETHSEKAKLNDQDYTLRNIRRFGGVCAMQADFAARVGKSMGIPAAYVGGESRYGESHAWVMWVELLSVNQNSVTFSLESFGRYRGDKYYVGNLRDPQTGQAITDRQLELRLQTVGLNAQNKRHAELIMNVYPLFVKKAQMNVPEQLMFLYRVIDLCPGNEEAWRSIARMSREGIVTNTHNKAMVKALEKMFTTFAAFPDFTWEIFDDLIAYQDVRKQREKHYGCLVAMYEMAERPDLACKARLKYADYLIEQQEHQRAIDGLAVTVMRFPKEGRYVPKMLDKMEAISEQVDGSDAKLVEFYQVLLPKIPKRRGSRASPYCIKMYKRAIDRFKAAGQDQAARYYQSQLALLEAG